MPKYYCDSQIANGLIPKRLTELINGYFKTIH